MKKTKGIFLIFALSLMICLIACGKEKSPPIVPMDESEISAVEEAFYVMLPLDGEMQINPRNCFLSSYYDSVDKLDLQAFLRYFPGSEQGTEQEFEALRNFKDWPFSQCENLWDMPVPLHRYDAENVRLALERYGNISLEQTDYKEAPGVYYLEEFDAFYNYTSDFGLEPLRCIYGEKQGDRLYLYSERWGGETARLTLEKNGDDYIIISHQLVENE